MFTRPSDPEIRMSLFEMLHRRRGRKHVFEYSELNVPPVANVLW